jgi:RNA polymerase sigma-70 factor (ECF subfamily)
LVERTEEAPLLEALRAGDEGAFARLVDELSGPMRRLARSFVPTAAVAEDVVQETWLAVLEGLDRFEGRSSLKTWIFRILTNRAITRGQRERRSIPFSSLVDAEAGHAEPAVDPSRFRPPGSQWAGGWLEPPRSWDPIPEDRLLSNETLAVISSAIGQLPSGQRSVITLRDVDGFGSQEACNVLGISETNQRVLLHRARSRVRRALERYFDDADESAGAERG